MGTRYLTADYVFTSTAPPIKDGVVVVDEKGIILSVEDAEYRKKYSGLEQYQGIICPGFINTHCHLELSHLKGQIPEKVGMPGFIKQLLSKRNNFSKEEINKAIIDAEEEMLKNGIVAVGDISNNDATFSHKAKSKIKYHTFIEVYDLDPEKAEDVFEKAIELRKKLSGANRQASIIPHASYTVSEKLFRQIHAYAQQHNSILSIHNQESTAENELFISKTGALVDLFTTMGIKLDYIKKTGFNSLRSMVVRLPQTNKILFVHNTNTDRDDIRWVDFYYHQEWDPTLEYAVEIKRTKKKNKVYWCFCPNANLYIENKLPDFNSFVAEHAKITIGTDSYASNKSLSILDELKTISKHAPHISLEKMLIWATKNGADFLELDKGLGVIKKGKKPGLNLITNVDLKKLRLTSESKIEVLL